MDVSDSMDAVDGCAPEEIGMKSFFLGPQGENGEWFGEMVQEVVERYVDWRRAVYPGDGRAISTGDQSTEAFIRRRRRFEERVAEVVERFEEEVPKFSPRYIGHMFSETSMPAMVGHLITMLHNPNNIGGESSRVGVTLEDEAIERLGEMLGIEGKSYGHFTSGGTVANFEAMVRARKRQRRWMIAAANDRVAGGKKWGLMEAAHLGWEAYEALCEQGVATGLPEGVSDHPWSMGRWFEEVFQERYRGPVVLVPGNKHYSWVKGVEIMGLGKEAFWSVALDERGRMRPQALAERIEEARAQSRPVLMAVSVAGTTELGTFDPVGEIADLLDRYRGEEGLSIYHHVDGAYGGFFAANICGRAPQGVMRAGVCDALAALGRAQSVTLDPHKLGYVPYSSGAIVVADERDYFVGGIDAPYLAFEKGKDRGPETIEGSRSAAGAVATWLTAETIGLDADGYGRILGRTIEARKRVQEALEQRQMGVRCVDPSTNVLAFCVAHQGEKVSAVNRRSRTLYEAFSPEENGAFFVSRTTLRRQEYGALFERFVGQWEGVADEESITLIRLCVMNPFLDSRETEVDFARAFAEAVEWELSEGEVLENRTGVA